MFMCLVPLVALHFERLLLLFFRMASNSKPALGTFESSYRHSGMLGWAMAHEVGHDVATQFVDSHASWVYNNKKLRDADPSAEDLPRTLDLPEWSVSTRVLLNLLPWWASKLKGGSAGHARARS